MYWRFSFDRTAPLALGAWPLALMNRDRKPDLSLRRLHFTDPLRQARAPATPVKGEEGDHKTGTECDA